MNYIQRLFENAEVFSLKENTGESAFEGNSLSGILIICSGSITDEEKFFLDKILTSVKLKLNEVMLMQSENASAFHRMKAALGFKKLILFGVAPREIGLNTACSMYVPSDFQDTQILASESLSVLEESATSKTLLWKALKKMFL